MRYQKCSEGTETTVVMDSGKKDVAYTDGSFSDKTGSMRGTIKNGAMTIWRKDFKKKGSPIITISVDEVDKALEKGSANSEATLRKLAKQRDYAATDAWIDGTKDQKVRQKRSNLWENNGLTGKLSALEEMTVDSVLRVIKSLYEVAKGEPPKSSWEKHQETKRF